MRFRSIACAAAAAVLLSIPAWAHHSHANYNINEFINLSGTITSVAWTNPHVWINMEVADAQGRPQMWALEATGRTGLQRIGVTPDYVKAGDAVKARCHHLRDGSNGCLLGFLKAKDGTVKDWDGNNAPAPTDF